MAEEEAAQARGGAVNGSSGVEALVLEAEEAGAWRQWWTTARQGYSGESAGLERTGGSGLGDPT